MMLVKPSQAPQLTCSSRKVANCGEGSQWAALTYLYLLICVFLDWVQCGNIVFDIPPDAF